MRLWKWSTGHVDDHVVRLWNRGSNYVPVRLPTTWIAENGKPGWANILFESFLRCNLKKFCPAGDENETDGKRDWLWLSTYWEAMINATLFDGNAMISDIPRASRMGSEPVSYTILAEFNLWNFKFIGTSLKRAKNVNRSVRLEPNLQNSSLRGHKIVTSSTLHHSS